MYIVEVEYKLQGRWIREVLEGVIADDELDARDVAYSQVKRNTPSAEFIEVLNVNNEVEGV